MPSLVASVLHCKSYPTSSPAHHPPVPRKAPIDDLSTFAQNLQRIVDAGGAPKSGSVNGWAKRHGLAQPTIRRILTGAQSPTENMIEVIAGKVGVMPWQLLVPGMTRDNPPVLREANEAERRFHEKIRAAFDELAEFREQGSTRPGSFDA